jgi:hypothetical protein
MAKPAADHREHLVDHGHRRQRESPGYRVEGGSGNYTAAACRYGPQRVQ